MHAQGSSLLGYKIHLYLFIVLKCIILSGGFLGGAVLKNPPADAEDKRHGFNPWVRKIPWNRKWQPVLVCLPGKSHGQRSLVGCHPWGHKELLQLNDWAHTHTHAHAHAHTHTHTQYLLYAFSQSRDSKIQLQQIRTWEAISWGSGKTYLKVSTFFFLPNFWHCLSLTLSHP